VNPERAVAPLAVSATPSKPMNALTSSGQGGYMTLSRCAELLKAASRARILVVGDVILDHFIWGKVSRISPEAPVPVVDFLRENFMPGGAANVARNITELGGHAQIFGVVGRDAEASRLGELLAKTNVCVDGLVAASHRHTTAKMRIVAGQQQITRLDRETKGPLDPTAAKMLAARIERALEHADAVVVGDYDKGVLSQPLLDLMRHICRRRKIWLSLDPKPTRALNLRGLSLLTPNRKEVFQLAGVTESDRCSNPLRDEQLQSVARLVLEKFEPDVLLVTLSELGMLVCQKNREPVHIPTVAQEVFDVSGAGDTVIASFTLAIVAGATPTEAAAFSNHAAGVVVGKVGTATVTPRELRRSIKGACHINRKEAV